MIRAVRPSMAMVVDHPTKVGEARRRAAIVGARLGFAETDRGRLALVVTEAATNLAKHTPRGEVVVQGWRGPGDRPVVDVHALDGGPGMADVGRCLVDGYSTAGSSGTGLGAISRVADRFAIHSAPGVGTALWARIGLGPPAPSEGAAMDLGVVGVAAAGQDDSGDEWAALTREGMEFLLVVDGLGHGPQAAEAAEGAVAVFQASSSTEPGEIIAATSDAIRGTRGAAMAIARVDSRRGEVRFAGVGNISAVVLDRASGRTSSMISMNGTVGHSIRRIQAFDYEWTDGAAILLHSDGLDRRWDLSRHSGLAMRHPAMVAGVLYRDHRRERDDATILVAARGG